MKISIVTLAMMKKQQGRFYNAQDIGLGRALADMGNEVDVFNFILPEDSKEESGAKGSGKTLPDAESVTQLGERLYLHQIQTKAAGVHSMYKKDFIPQGTQGVICFSDNQMNFGHVLKLCRKRRIPCIPYVGVLASNSGSRIKSMLMNLVSDNMKYYRHMTVLAKTPAVRENLMNQGACSVVLAPVCLDKTMLNQSYADTDVDELKKELGRRHGLDFTGGLVLYVGRLQAEKEPVEMVRVFARIKHVKPDCRLIMIGRGELEGEVRAEIKRLGFGEDVVLLDRVENSRMWEYYRAADAVVNLNKHEIFGMSILEAMYYERKVVAVRAPGPEFIIKDESMGILCMNADMAAEAVYKKDTGFDQKSAHQRIEDKFLWSATAEIISGELAKLRHDGEYGR